MTLERALELLASTEAQLNAHLQARLKAEQRVQELQAKWCADFDSSTRSLEEERRHFQKCFLQAERERDKARAQVMALTQQSVPPTPGLASIVGQWPGDETDGEVNAALHPAPKQGGMGPGTCPHGTPETHGCFQCAKETRADDPGRTHSVGDDCPGGHRETKPAPIQECPNCLVHYRVPGWLAPEAVARVREILGGCDCGDCAACLALAILDGGK